MSTVTSILSTDLVSDSRTTINTNFTNLNNSAPASFIVAPTAGYGDYTNLQSAIDALPSTGGRIFVKAGTYTVGAAGIRFSKSNVVIEGEGPATRFNFNTASLSTCFAMADTTQRTHIRLKNFRISQQGTAGTGVAIDASYFAICTFEDITIDGVNGGMLFNAIGTLYNSTKNITISCAGANSYGMKFDTTANENTVFRTRVMTTSASTGLIVNSHGNSFYDYDVETGAAIAFDIQGTGNDTTLYSPYSEGNIIGLKIAANVEALTVIGGIIIDSSTNNIVNNGGKGINIYNLRLQYEQFTYRESLNGFPAYRWLFPYYGGGTVVVTSATPVAGTVYCEEFEVQEAVFVTGISYVKGGTQAGNVTVGIYGPIITEETCASAPLIANSASTAVSAGTNTEQHVAFTGTVLLEAGRYYAAIEFDDATNTFQRQSNQTQVVGWGQTYARGGGYGALTDPAPAMTNTGSNLPGLKIKCTGLTTV